MRVVATFGGFAHCDGAICGNDFARARDPKSIALKAAARFLLVLPAGQAAHIEAGIAYGLGKPSYAVGPHERSDTLYRIFDEMFRGPADLESWLRDPLSNRFAADLAG